MTIEFPYADYEPLKIASQHEARVFTLPDYRPQVVGREAVRAALQAPIGSARLAELARGKRRVLIVVDDVSRPTPVADFVDLVLHELHSAGVEDARIEFLAALGTHRTMTRSELKAKLGDAVVGHYAVHNHEWANANGLEYIGDSDQGVPVWVNRRLRDAELVVGLGAIMPLEVSGFTGGGKILVPGVCGEETVDQMHWKRIDLATHEILGKADNPVRRSIDSLARKAGLHFIVNVILNAENQIVSAVAGDMCDAHRAGCEVARQVFGVRVPKEYDIVVADAHPFDIEFWQANKALDTAGLVVRPGGVVILATPCYEGFSRTHAEDIRKHGYPQIGKIKQLVDSGQIRHKVVGVHMFQVSSVVAEKARLILVATGISQQEAESVGLQWAETAQQAFSRAEEVTGPSASVAVLHDAARMLALVEGKG